MRKSLSALVIAFAFASACAREAPHGREQVKLTCAATLGAAAAITTNAPAAEVLRFREEYLRTELEALDRTRDWPSEIRSAARELDPNSESWPQAVDACLEAQNADQAFMTAYFKRFN